MSSRRSADKATESDHDSLCTSSIGSSSSVISGTMRSKAWSRRSSQERRNSKMDSRGMKTESKMTPFYLRWSFGATMKTPVQNITTTQRPLIFYSSCHLGILYDYKAKEMRLLQGHHNPITSISADQTGHWLATADAGTDNVVIVWDSEICLPIHTLFNPHPEVGTRVVGMSPDAKYLVIVSNTPVSIVSLWQWTYGKDAPDAVCEMKPDFGAIHNLIFNPALPEEFMVTSTENVAFFTWNPGEKTLGFSEANFTKHKVGSFNESVFLPEISQQLTSTNKGFVLIWGVTKTERRRLVKEIRLQKDGITCIRSQLTIKQEDDCQRVVVTGNSLGHIRFYDQRLRILFWCQNFTLGALTAINFHIGVRKFHLSDTMLASERISSPPRPFKMGSVSSSPRLELVPEDRSEEYDNIYTDLVPSDASLGRRPFVVGDFIVSTEKGDISLVNFLDNELQPLITSSESAVTAITVHPELPHLVVGNESGLVTSYNYLRKEQVTSSRLPLENPLGTNHISCLAFAPSGLFLVCTLIDGTLWILDPNLLSPLFTPPFKNTKSSITKIAFTADSQYMAYIDTTMSTSLYLCEDLSGHNLVYYGKQRAHYKPVRDLLFGEVGSPPTPRLFTLGEDRVMVEYEVTTGLLIYNMERIEQTAIPLCMTWHPMLTPERFILTANDEFKYKLLNHTTKMCRKTVQTTLLDAPVSRFEVLGSNKKPEQNKSYLVFATQKQIGIQMLPLDGNPYKFVSMTGHPLKINQMCVTPDDKYLFTIGEQDSSVLMWKINVRSVDVMARIGGEGVNPFYCLIEGGQQGWLFQEMQDLFYYAQIIHQGESQPTTRKVSDQIPLCELPDLMRAIGFYPSEYEVENLLHEVHYSNYAETGQQENYINFENFVRLYTNHRPANGYSVKVLKKAFAMFSTDGEVITRDSFLDVMQEKGEYFTSEQAAKYLDVLLPKESKRAKEGDTEGEPGDVPRQLEEFSFTMFADDILGITYDTPDMKPGDVTK